MVNHRSIWIASCFVGGAIAGTAVLHSPPAEAVNYKWLPAMACASVRDGYDPGRENETHVISGGAPDTDSEVVCSLERDQWGASLMRVRVYANGVMPCQVWVCDERGMFGPGGCLTVAQSFPGGGWTNKVFDINRPDEDGVSLSCSLSQGDTLGGISIWEY